MSYECRELAVHAILNHVDFDFLVLAGLYGIYVLIQTAFILRWFLRQPLSPPPVSKSEA